MGLTLIQAKAYDTNDATVYKTVKWIEGAPFIKHLVFVLPGCEETYQ